MKLINLIDIGIFIIFVLCIIGVVLLILGSFSTPFKECENKSDDYMVKNFRTDGEYNMISCGEVNAIDTSLSLNRGVLR